MTASTSHSSFAPDMSVIGIRLRQDAIVLLSWFVSEYDGIGFVKSEVAAPDRSGETLDSENNGVVSLFFPEEKRDDVLELLGSLRAEGMQLEILFEAPPVTSSLSEEDAEKEWILGDRDTL